MAFILLHSTVRKGKPAEAPPVPRAFPYERCRMDLPRISGGQGRRARSVALLHPAIDQGKSFGEGMGEFEGEGEGFFQKVLPFPLITYLLQLLSSEGPCQRRHNWWDSPS